MALVKQDRVKETTTTTGTGNLTLAGAMTGYRAFSAVCSTNDTLWYALQAVDGSGNPTGDWEVGLGTYSGSNTLTRTTVYNSSNSGSAVNLASGTKQVWIDLPSSKLLASVGTFETVPTNTGFSWVNQGSATINTVDSGLTLYTPSSGSDSLRTRVMTAPGTPYQVVARFTIAPLATNFVGGGLCWRDSASGKIQSWGHLYSGAVAMASQNWNSATSFSANQIAAISSAPVPWWRLVDDGTNRKCDVSSDGVNWVTVGSFARTTFITPDQVGFFVNTNTVSRDITMTVHHWYAGT